MNSPENKSVLDILAMRESRLNAAIARESNAIATLSNFCVTEKSVLYAQSEAVLAVLAPPFGAVASTTTTTPATSLGSSGKRIIKRKLPEKNDGWKDHSGKTHRINRENMQYHKSLSCILWQIMDIIHEHASNGSGTPTPNVLLVRLVPFKEMDEKWETFTIKELLETGLNFVHA
jgi:membrane protein YqaA with SNARE-associated domain